MAISSRELVVIVFNTLVVAACSGGTTTTTGSSSSSSGGSATTTCRQKADADTDDDCDGHPGMPRKLDCDDDSQTASALSAGCVREKEGDNDVCCPTTVSGQKEVTVNGCTEPADTLTDSDCVGTAEARKLTCTTDAQQKAAIAVGCRPEDAGDTGDYDVCCPTNVRAK